jgi:1,4-alpha-glucan branching enzyme
MGAHPWRTGDIDGTLFSTWAPNARQVSVIGDFNDWDRRCHPMRSRGASGVWELFIPGIGRGSLYKFAVVAQDGNVLDKADPLALRSEFRPRTASVVESLDDLRWDDGAWMDARAASDPLARPMSIYEVHAGSWKRPSDGRDYASWEELSIELVDYVRETGFTHIELLPVMEHPFDGSWGYQTLGYFAPTSRHGSPSDFAAFVNVCHRAGIGVILDWTPAHFPGDAHGLARYDGTALYEHEDPRLGRHPDWNTNIFNYGRNEVRNFLLASALFWLDRYHIDGLRVDAVASMLYLDYSRKQGEWIPNRFGGRENLDAVGFIRELNEKAHGMYRGAVVIAEESTAWPAVSRPVWLGGLGFTFKWNMGWMHDTLRFMSQDPVFRKYHLNDLTFSLLYAYTENFTLPLSHDEVVHGKGSLIGKMPGDDWRKFASLRTLLAYQWAHPGKKLLFMGGEFGQWSEWDHDGQLEWDLLQYDRHWGLKLLVHDLNTVMRSRTPLHEMDHSADGFRWIDFRDTDQTVVSFRRMDPEGREVICVFNFTPVPRQGYRLGVPSCSFYAEILNTDAAAYGGSGMGNMGGLEAEPVPWHGLPFSLNLTLPPLAAVYLEPGAPPDSVEDRDEWQD